MLEKDNAITLFEKMYEILNTDDWTTNIVEYIKPYKRYLEILQVLESCIENNNLYLSKSLIKNELKMMKGIRENNCKRYKINKGYCEICNNVYCSLNENTKYKTVKEK